MSNTEKFCLRWNDFESNISVAFRELREEKDFFDVTLACDDSQIQAHKVILSACSPFFRNVLRRNPHQHPLLYLKGVKYTELLSVLNFMYMGEVNVAQEELNSFLAVAEDLRVKGLTQNNSSGETPVRSQPKQETVKHSSRPREPPERDQIPPPKRPRPMPPNPPMQIQEQTQSFHQDDDIQEVVPVKSEPRDPVSHPVVDQQVYHHQDQGMVDEQPQGTVALGDTYEEESYDYGQYEESYDDGNGMIMAGMGTDANKDVETMIFSKMSRVPGLPTVLWQCLECSFTSKNRHNVFDHVESRHVKHEGYMCQICTKTCPTLGAFRKHMSRNHGPPKLF